MTESAGRPQKKWKSRTFVTDASAKKKLLKTISSGIFHQQQKKEFLIWSASQSKRSTDNFPLFIKEQSLINKYY
ncbi:hypothetical protein [Klebsiella aerogenes]|uniref:hypothetical protein n=1 Tax=Klebsiella aerogenes TaxID=548 RepID=UPI00388D8BD0|nr:hypothetical protein [Klebsiella aerogenes]